MSTDYVVSLIRTVVPVLVGVAATALLRVGVQLDTASTVAVVQAVLTGLWYAAVRYAERRWPQVGWLLGRPSAPTYKEKR